MLCCPFNWRFLEGFPHGLEQVKILLATFGQEVHSTRFERTRDVKSKENGALGDAVVVIETVDQGDNVGRCVHLQLWHL